MRVPVGRYLPLTRRPNGIPSTVTGAQYQRPLCARTYNTKSGRRIIYSISPLSFFFLSFFPSFLYLRPRNLFDYSLYGSVVRSKTRSTT